MGAVRAGETPASTQKLKPRCSKLKNYPEQQ
jgi:hypothetical protein